MLPAHHEKYRAVSHGVMALFRDITPLVEPLSVDEAFLNVGGAVRRLGPPAAIGASIRAQVVERFGVTCSVGVASTKFVAKLASTSSKPDGLRVVPRDAVIEFLHPLPVGALWGVGGRTEQVLHGLGLRTVGDLAATPVRTLQAALGAAAGAHLAALAWGRDDRAVTPGDGEPASAPSTPSTATSTNPSGSARSSLRLSDRVAARARAAGRAGRTVAIKIRLADFTTVTRSRTLAEPTDVARDVYAAALELTPRSGSTGPASGWPASGSRGWASAASRPASSSSTPPTSGGGRPSRRSTAPSRVRPRRGAKGPAGRPGRGPGTRDLRHLSVRPAGLIWWLRFRGRRRLLMLVPSTKSAVGTPASASRHDGGAMPLSEHEQRLLEQMERALYAEDQKFVQTFAVRTRVGVGVVSSASRSSASWWASGSCSSASPSPASCGSDPSASW